MGYISTSCTLHSTQAFPYSLFPHSPLPFLLSPLIPPPTPLSFLSQVLRPGVGYFRPIDKTSHGGFRADLMRQAVKLRTPLEDMYALTQEEAYALLSADNIDDMLEKVLNGEWNGRGYDW